MNYVIQLKQYISIFKQLKIQCKHVILILIQEWNHDLNTSIKA